MQNRANNPMQTEILAGGRVDHAPSMILDCRGQSIPELGARSGEIVAMARYLRATTSE